MREQESPRSAPSAWSWGVVAAVAARPRLWGVAVSQVVRLARSGWWRRWPPVPSPDRSYLAFRTQTAYGDPNRRPDPDDVVAWLEWCRRMKRLR